MAILGGEARESVLTLGHSDFEDSNERIVFAVLAGMIRDQAPIDVVTVSAGVAATGQAPMLTASELYRWVSAAPAPVMAPEYARLIREKTRARLARDTTDALTRMLHKPESVSELSRALSWFNNEINCLPPLIDNENVDDTVAALLLEPEEQTEWVVPGLIARGERTVITGHEGHGKSVLLRQLSSCVAAGVHPWTGEQSHKPARVLHVDVENSRPQTRRGYRRMQQLKEYLPDGWAKNITVKIRPAGIDLLGSDSGWLHQVASECSPDLIVIGPAYKAMTGDPQRDRDVLALLSALDEVRVRFNSAMLIEHHSPHGTGDGPRTTRPYGSSVWLRWPEVGLGLREHERDEAGQYIRQEESIRTGQPAPIDWLDVVRWRPPREPRAWPTEITWGTQDELPWKPVGNYNPGLVST